MLLQNHTQYFSFNHSNRAHFVFDSNFFIILVSLENYY